MQNQRIDLTRYWPTPCSGKPRHITGKAEKSWEQPRKKSPVPAREEVRLCYPNTFILSISPASFFRGVIQVLKLASPVNTQCADGTNSGFCFTSGEVGFAVFSCSQMVQTVRFILSRQIGAVTCSANISVKNPWCAAFTQNRYWQDRLCTDKQEGKANTLCLYSFTRYVAISFLQILCRWKSRPHAAVNQ